MRFPTQFVPFFLVEMLSLCCMNMPAPGFSTLALLSVTVFVLFAGVIDLRAQNNRRIRNDVRDPVFWSGDVGKGVTR